MLKLWACESCNRNQLRPGFSVQKQGLVLESFLKVTKIRKSKFEVLCTTFGIRSLLRTSHKKNERLKM